MNPNSSFRHRPADMPPIGTQVPWWEAVPWNGRAPIIRLRSAGLVEEVCWAIVVEAAIMLALAIAGTVVAARGGVL